MPLIYLGLAAIAVDSFLWDLPRWPLLALLAVAFAIYLRLGTVRRPPVEVAVPVAGRWVASNSPVDRVPSHHLHAYGQTYAIDLVHEPADRRRPGLAWWPLARRPEDFGELASDSRWAAAALDPEPAVGTWTDDFHNLLSVFKW